MSGRDKNTSASSGDSPHVIAHYRILKRLGKGGMGEVFLGEDTKQHGRKVALKILPPEVTNDESRVRRFKQDFASLAFAYGSAGKRKEAEAILDRLKALSNQRYVSGLYFGIGYAGLKDNDRAIEYLNKAFESKHPGLVLIRIEPLFDNLRSDDCFKQLTGRFEPIP